MAAVVTPTGAGLWLVAADGTIARVGDAPPLRLSRRTHEAIVDATGVPGAMGLRATTATGVVFPAGAAGPAGEPAHTHHAANVVGITSTPDGLGYWLVTSDGRVLTFGDARFHGSAPRGAGSSDPIIGLATTADGRGYWLASRDGAIYAFGTARVARKRQMALTAVSVQQGDRNARTGCRHRRVPRRRSGLLGVRNDRTGRRTRHCRSLRRRQQPRDAHAVSSAQAVSGGDTSEVRPLPRLFAARTVHV